MTGMRLVGDGHRLEIQGDMTVNEAPALLDSLAGYSGITHIDLSAVQRVDSSALSILLAMSRAAGGTMVTVYHAPQALRALSDLYGLNTLFWVV